MTTASLDIWKDTGYTEGCLEVPKTTSTLSSPDYSFEGLEISTSSLFSEVKVKGEFAALFECSYLRMTYSMNNGSDVTVYGWIDNVAVGSDSAGSPMTRISWHVDLWRTYISKVTLGSGIVKRRTAEGTLPTQPYGNRYSLAKTARNIIPYNKTLLWVLLNITRTVDGATTTTPVVYPVNASGGSYTIKTFKNDLTGKTAPSYYETMNGTFDELFGLDPDAIYSAFISPISPFVYGIEDTTIWVSGTIDWQVETFKSGSDYGGYIPLGGWDYDATTFTTMAETTDITSYVITDFDRTPIGTLPWGLAVNGGDYRLINSDLSAYIAIRFTTANSTVEQAASNGLEFHIPLKTIAVGSNAKSSYVYSGQQEFDKQQMSIQRMQNAMSGLAGTANQGIQGAMGGALLGALTGPGGMAAGAVIGGVSSMVGSTISTIAENQIAGVANDMLMDATIRQKSQQTGSLILPSSGIDWVDFGYGPQLIPLQWDDYSITQRSQDMALYGAHVDEPRTSCQSLLTAGGPLQIANCTVLGSVPVQAKRYIKERLSNGVRIV